MEWVRGREEWWNETLEAEESTCEWTDQNSGDHFVHRTVSFKRPSSLHWCQPSISAWCRYLVSKLGVQTPLLDVLPETGINHSRLGITACENLGDVFGSDGASCEIEARKKRNKSQLVGSSSSGCLPPCPPQLQHFKKLTERSSILHDVDIHLGCNKTHVRQLEHVLGHLASSFFELVGGHNVANQSCTQAPLGIDPAE